jgi:hypothetical protein
LALVWVRAFFVLRFSVWQWGWFWAPIAFEAFTKLVVGLALPQGGDLLVAPVLRSELQNLLRAFAPGCGTERMRLVCGPFRWALAVLLRLRKLGAGRGGRWDDRVFQLARFNRRENDVALISPREPELGDFGRRQAMAWTRRPEEPFALPDLLDAAWRRNLEGFAADCASRSPDAEYDLSAVAADVLALADALPMALAVKEARECQGCCVGHWRLLALA